MRILIYSYNYFPEPIGIAPLMTELAEGLVGRGHEVRVVTAMPWYPQREIYPGYKGKPYLTEKRNGVYIQRNYVWVRPHPGLVDRVLLDGSFVISSCLHALQGTRPDVILMTAPPLPVSVPAAVLGMIWRCPVVLNLQDILPEAAVHTGLLRSKLLIRIFSILEKFAYRVATQISVIADGFVDNLVNKKGTPPEKITLIPNWVNINFIRPLPKQDNSFRKAHRIEGKFVVMYSGNIALTQGIETVVKAAALLLHQLGKLSEKIQCELGTELSEKIQRDIRVVIVGEGRALSELQQCRQEQEADNVLLLPFEPRGRLPQMLAAADVGLIVQKRNVISFNMPSKTPLLLASGRAIIASVPANGTAARAVTRSGGGVIVAPEEPEALAAEILRLYLHPDKAAALGEQGRRYAVEHYGIERALDRYEALFRAIAIAPRSRPIA